VILFNECSDCHKIFDFCELEPQGIALRKVHDYLFYVGILIKCPHCEKTVVGNEYGWDGIKPFQLSVNLMGQFKK